MKTLGEFEPLAGFFFKRSKETERPVNTQVLKVAREAIQQSQWNHDAMEKNIRDAADKAGLKARDVFMELRLAVTGKTVGPPLLESLEILGKKETIGRLSSIE
jgi:glutamyl-tRNA synthetase